MVSKSSTKTTKINVYQNPRPTVIRPTGKPARNSNCSVVLTDLQTDLANRIIKLETELLEVKSKCAAFESYHEQAEVISTIVNPEKCSSPSALNNASQFLHSLSTEVIERIKRSKHALVLNIPDKLDIKRVMNTLLRACGLQSSNFTALRLRKKSQKNHCPILVKFDNESTAQAFIQSQNLLRIKSPYEKIVICSDKTPLQRQQLSIKIAPPSSSIIPGNTVCTNNSTCDDIPLALDETEKAAPNTSLAETSLPTQEDNVAPYATPSNDIAPTSTHDEQASILSTTPNTTSHLPQLIATNSIQPTDHSENSFKRSKKRPNVTPGMLSRGQQHQAVSNNANHILHASQNQTDYPEPSSSKPAILPTHKNTPPSTRPNKPRLIRRNHNEPRPTTPYNWLPSLLPQSPFSTATAPHDLMTTFPMMNSNPPTTYHSNWHAQINNLMPVRLPHGPFFTIAPYMNALPRSPYQSSLQEMEWLNLSRFNNMVQHLPQYLIQ
jgi:hypothetical protein